MTLIKFNKAIIIGLMVTLPAWKANGQADSLIHSGWTISHGKNLADSGNYTQAIKEFQRIDPRDTNYVYAMDELARIHIDNNQFQEGLAAAEKGLATRSSYRSSLLTSKGKALSGLRDFKAAENLLLEATKEFPFDWNIPYELAIIYFNDGMVAESEKYFFATLGLNPYHSGAHLNLGRISMQMGQRIRGMMAMGMYLAINPNINRQLVLLDSFVLNEITDEFTLNPIDDNPYERLDEIIRAQIPMDAGYKTRIPINIGVVKHFHLLFQELGNQKVSQQDPWDKLYGPIYRKMQELNLADAFIYLLLTSTGRDDVVQWKKKNDATLTRLFSEVNILIGNHRKMGTVPTEFGYPGPVPHWYNDDNSVESIGLKDSEGQETGKWYYFDKNGERIADGLFVKGKKTGWWNYRNNDGFPTSRQNSDTGENWFLNHEGRAEQHYFLKSGKINGKLEDYLSCGDLLEEERNYVNGLREGKGKAYFPSGKLSIDFSFLNDSLEGPYVTYYESGIRHVEETYHRGLNTSTYVNRHPNGKIRITGTYANGKAEGIWTYYHSNGVISRKGIYHEDKGTGTWEAFDERGRLIERSLYDAQGDLHGDDETFMEGLLEASVTFNHGKAIAVTSFDRLGKAMDKKGDPGGNFAGDRVDADHRVRLKYKYANGIPDGTWKYFDVYGNIKKEDNYHEGKLHGPQKEYFTNGNVSKVTSYVNGEEHGKYESYYENGHLKSNGWSQRGNAEQNWLYYDENGILQADRYYLRNTQVGFEKVYDLDGKVLTQSEFDRGKAKAVTRYHSDGTTASETREDGQTKQVVQKSRSGKDLYSVMLLCGEINGSETSNFPDGKPFEEYHYQNGKLNGAFYTSTVSGIKDVEGYFIDGQRQGYSILHYEDGSKRSEGKYLDGARDSTWISYHRGGVISSKSENLKGERNGLTELFGPEGIKYGEKLFRDGDIIAYKSIDASGKMSDWVPFNGTGTITGRYPNGKTAFDDKYVRGVFDGERHLYYSTGKLFSIYAFKNNLAVGDAYEYYPDGKVRMHGQYKDDHAFGAWEYFDPTGKLIRRETYVAGVLHGPVVFFSVGKKSSEVKFRNGYPID